MNKIFIIFCITAISILTAGIAIFFHNKNKSLIQFEIHINPTAVYLSTYSEPPQFAIWLENKKNGRLKQIFVTNRAGLGDWEGKADVPSAIPHWVSIFRNEKKALEDNEVAISGATPRKEYFNIDAEVKPDSEWIVWIEMNLAGDYNEYYPYFDNLTHKEDEYACGQPALLYKADIKAEVGNIYSPELEAMSLWENGKTSLIPIDSTITSAHLIFDEINIKITKPKFRFVNFF